MSEKVQLTVSGIQADLNNGLSREEIRLKYGLTGKDLKGVFSHPKLKGLKTKVGPQYNLVDDTPEVEVVNEAEGTTTEVEEVATPLVATTEEVVNDDTAENTVEDTTTENAPVVTEEF